MRDLEGVAVTVTELSCLCLVEGMWEGSRGGDCSSEKRAHEERDREGKKGAANMRLSFHGEKSKRRVVNRARGLGEGGGTGQIQVVLPSASCRRWTPVDGGRPVITAATTVAGVHAVPAELVDNRVGATRA